MLFYFNCRAKVSSTKSKVQISIEKTKKEIFVFLKNLSYLCHQYEESKFNHIDVLLDAGAVGSIPL